MFKVGLGFDIDRLKQGILEQLYDKMDETSEPEDLNCVDRALVRVYEDKGREEDYGRFRAAIFALKQTPELARNIKECIWYSGSAKENLLTGSMRNQYMNSGQKKEIDLDLDTNALKIYYTKGDWRNAYRDVRNLLRRWSDERGSANTYIGFYGGWSAEADGFRYLLY